MDTNPCIRTLIGVATSQVASGDFSRHVDVANRDEVRCREGHHATGGGEARHRDGGTGVSQRVLERVGPTGTAIMVKGSGCMPMHAQGAENLAAFYDANLNFKTSLQQIPNIFRW